MDVLLSLRPGLSWAGCGGNDSERTEGAGVRVGLQVPRFTWPGAPGSIGPGLARIARTADEAGFTSIWVMDHFFQIEMVGRCRGGADAGGLLRAQLYRGRYRAREARGAGDRGAVPPPEHPPKNRHHARRPLRGPRLPVRRRRLVRARVPGLGRPVPPNVRALRAAGGDASNCPPDVVGRYRTIRGRALPARGAYEQPASFGRPASADHGRRHGGAEDAEAGGPLRQRVQPLLLWGAPGPT